MANLFNSFMPGETAGVPDAWWAKQGGGILSPSQPAPNGGLLGKPDWGSKLGAAGAFLLDANSNLYGQGKGGNLDAFRARQTAAADEQRKAELKQKVMGAIGPDGQLDMAKVREILASEGDIQGLLGLQPKPEEYDATPRTVIDPKTGNHILIQTSKSGATMALPFGAVDNDLLSPEALAQKQGIAKAGASNVTVNAGNTLGTSLAGGVGEILKTSQTQAQGALQTIDTANQIRDAISSGKVMAGPTTSLKVWAAQAFGGDQNKLNETRKAIQGLAKLTLAARSQLKGQGQISDYEGKVLAKATSGEIDDLSVGEIDTLAQLADRAARLQIKSNADTLGRVRKTLDPSMSPMLDVYSVDAPAPWAPAKKSAPVGNDGWGQPRVKGN